MLLGIEVAEPRDDVSGQTDAYYFKNSFEHQETKMPYGRVRIMGVGERL